MVVKKQSTICHWWFLTKAGRVTIPEETGMCNYKLSRFHYVSLFNNGIFIMFYYTLRNLFTIKAADLQMVKKTINTVQVMFIGEICYYWTPNSSKKSWQNRW